MDRLADLAARVPGGGDVEAAWHAVESRAGAIRRRRRLAVAGALALLAVAGIAAVLVAGDDAVTTDVAAVPSTTEPVQPTVPTTPLPTTVAGPAATVPSTTAPIELSACRDGIAGEPGPVTEGPALAVVGAFLSDREAITRSSVRAGDPWACLGPDALAVFEAGELCMSSCDGLVVTVPSDVEAVPFGSTEEQQIVTVLLDSSGGPYREEYRVGVVDGRVLIVSATRRPASNVDELAARTVLAEFLDALVDRDFGVAAELLINEGASGEVLASIPGLLERQEAAVEEWCDRNEACEYPAYEIGEVVATLPDSLRFEVRFGTDEQPTKVMDVLAFEGRLTVGSLPPTR